MVLANFDIFTAEHPLILASQSPRRARILEMLEIPFRIEPSQYEEILDPQLSPEQNAEMLALGKAEEVLARFPDSWVVGVDTLVVSATGEILGKPENAQDAAQMFRKKSGQQETVISGIALISSQKKIVAHESATLSFSKIDAAEIEHILALEEWKGVSGGICVEGKSSFCIERIEGNLWNIIGFPIPTFMKMLQTFFEAH